LLVLGGTVYANTPVGRILLTFGSLLFSAGVVGLTLNALWWRDWAKRAILEIFSDAESVGKLHQNAEQMHKRFDALIGATYGTGFLSKRFTTTLRRDVFNRLAIPVRRNFELCYSLKHVDMVSGDSRLVLGRLSRQVSYQLYNYSRLDAEPFGDGIIASGFVDIAEPLLQEWKARLGSNNLTADNTGQELLKLNDELRICTFPLISIGGQILVEKEDFVVELTPDGTKREPQIAYVVKLTEAAQRKFKLQATGKAETSVIHLHEALVNLTAYDFSICNQITEEATFHFDYDPCFCGTMRYIMPPHWGQEQREAIPAGPEKVSLYVHTVLFPGHAVLVSWRLKDEDLKRGLGTWEKVAPKRPEKDSIQKPQEKTEKEPK